MTEMLTVTKYKSRFGVQNQQHRVMSQGTRDLVMGTGRWTSGQAWDLGACTVLEALVYVAGFGVSCSEGLGPDPTSLKVLGATLS